MVSSVDRPVLHSLFRYHAHFRSEKILNECGVRTPLLCREFPKVLCSRYFLVMHSFDPFHQNWLSVSWRITEGAPLLVCFYMIIAYVPRDHIISIIWALIVLSFQKGNLWREHYSGLSCSRTNDSERSKIAWYPIDHVPFLRASYTSSSTYEPTHLLSPNALFRR